MSFYGIANTVAGGLRQRQDNLDRDTQRARAASAEQRAAAAESRTQQRFDVEMKDFEKKQKYDEWTRHHQQAMASFLTTNGEDTSSLESAYNQFYPDGKKMKIDRQGDGYVVGFSDGTRVGFQGKEQLAQMWHAVGDPAAFMEDIKKAAERDTAKKDKREELDYKFGQDKELAGIKHGQRMAETAAGRKPEIMTSDDGRLVTVQDGQMAIVKPPAGVAADGLTFKGSGKGAQKTPQDVLLMDELKRRGVAKDDNQAWDLVSRGKSDPIKMATQLASAEIEMQAFSVPEDGAVKETPEQIMMRWQQFFTNAKLGTAPQPAAASPASQDAPPPQALSRLREGTDTRFGNGQVWTIQGGKPVRVQ